MSRTTVNLKDSELGFLDSYLTRELRVLENAVTMCKKAKIGVPRTSARRMNFYQNLLRKVQKARVK